MLTPSASITSALPLLLLTLRPPCLLTLAPAAAATNMAQVEMLKVCEPSPPVPTMSTRWVLSATSTLVENSRITCAAAVISPMVSFLTRRPVMKRGHHHRRHLAAHDAGASGAASRREKSRGARWCAAALPAGDLAGLGMVILSSMGSVGQMLASVPAAAGGCDRASSAKNSRSTASAWSMPAASTSRWVTKRRPIRPVASTPCAFR